LAAVNRNIVAVIYSGGICGLGRSVGNIKGLIYAFYPGQESGRALADVLLGDYDPAGRLPVTMPTSDAQLPAWNDDFTDDEGGGYRWFDRQGLSPQFAFGFGLSYTRFSYSGLSVTPSSVDPGVPVTVRFTLTNTGDRDGEEVVQLYLSDDASTHAMPVKELKAFRRVAVPAGGNIVVDLSLTADELYYYDESLGEYSVEPGAFTIRVGGSSDDLPLTGHFDVVDGMRRPDLLITAIRTVPAFPLPGQPVQFLATVKNQGTIDVAAGTPWRIAFTVDGLEMARYDSTTPSIRPGGMALVCATSGPQGSGAWNAGPAGVYILAAAIDPTGAVDECDEANNTLDRSLTVYTPPPVNLALHAQATATSVERTGYEAARAVDGSMGTRWSSAFSDPQMLQIDLDAVHQIDDIVLYWESAYASSYIVQMTDGISGWTVVRNELNGDGGVDKILVGGPGRTIRIIGVHRGTEWGYSLYEVEVHGPTSTIVPYDSPMVSATSFVLADNFPNPFNPTTTLSFTVDREAAASLQVSDALGRTVGVLFQEVALPGRTYRVRFDGANLPAGVYFVRLSTVGRMCVRKMLLVK
ncbi:MAG: glycoside hydrolase family 3 C-terminal domain-containing protein, partial [Bacteroidota bacterium]